MAALDVGELLQQKHAAEAEAQAQATLNAHLHDELAQVSCLHLEAHVGFWSQQTSPWLSRIAFPCTVAIALGCCFFQADESVDDAACKY